MPSLSTGGWVWLIVLGAWSGLSYIPTYVAFGKGKVSLLSPIFAAYAVVVALISGLFLGEVIPGMRWVAFAIVFFGILLITGDLRDLSSMFRGNYKEKDARVRGLPEILLAVVLYSLWLIALDAFVGGRYWVPLLLVIRIFSSLALFLYARLRNVQLTFSDRSLWKYLIAIGVFDVAAFAFVTWGFSSTSHASIVAMLSSAFSLPTIILARIFLKERSTRLQAVGSIVVVAGIMFLALV